MNLKHAAAVFERVDREVWIVTAAHAGRRAGMTATFVSPASIVPEMPRVLAGIAKTHETRKLIETSGAFAVHLLRESQLDWVWRFGLQSSRDVDKFADLDITTAATGSPILKDALAWLDCRIETSMDTGDRTVFLGQVVDCGSNDDEQPLSLHKLLAAAPQKQKQTLREQMEADAARDTEAINRWRARKSE